MSPDLGPLGPPQEERGGVINLLSAMDSSMSEWKRWNKGEGRAARRNLPSDVSSVGQWHHSLYILSIRDLLQVFMALTCLGGRDAKGA